MAKKEAKPTRFHAPLHEIFTGVDVVAFEPDYGLDRDQQISRTLDWMRSDIPREHLSREKGRRRDEEFTCFGEPVLEDAICGSFRDEEDIATFLGKTFFGPSHDRVMAAYARTELTKRKPKGQNFRHLAEDLAEFVYRPWDSLNTWGQHLDQNIRQRIKSPGVRELNTLQPVRELQAKVLAELIERNEYNLTVARHMPYRFGVAEETLLDPRDLFQIHGPLADAVDPAAGVYHFSFLTCHIEYFQWPQFGKWETIYSDQSGLAFDEIVELVEGGIVPGRPDEEVVEDMKQQLWALGGVLKSHVFNAASMEGQLREVADGLEEQVTDLTAKVEAAAGQAKSVSAAECRGGHTGPLVIASPKMLGLVGTNETFVPLLQYAQRALGNLSPQEYVPVDDEGIAFLDKVDDRITHHACYQIEAIPGQTYAYFTITPTGVVVIQSVRDTKPGGRDYKFLLEQ